MKQILCDYCLERPAEGLIGYTQDKVCLECFEDNHGMN